LAELTACADIAVLEPRHGQPGYLFSNWLTEFTAGPGFGASEDVLT